MEVVTIESGAFKAIEGMFSELKLMVKDLAAENKSLKENKLLSVSEVCELTGYGEAWVLKNKGKIGFSQATGGLIFFKNDVIDFFKNSKYYYKTK